MNGGMERHSHVEWKRSGIQQAKLPDLLHFSTAAKMSDRSKLWLMLNHLTPGASKEHIEACVAIISRDDSWNEISKDVITELGASAEIISVLYGVAKSRAAAPKLVDFLESDLPWAVELVVGAVRIRGGFSYWSSHEMASIFETKAVLSRCDDPLGTNVEISLSRRNGQFIEVNCSEIDCVATHSDSIMPNFLIVTHFSGV